MIQLILFAFLLFALGYYMCRLNHSSDFNDWMQYPRTILCIFVLIYLLFMDMTWILILMR